MSMTIGLGSGIVWCGDFGLDCGTTTFVLIPKLQLAEAILSAGQIEVWLSREGEVPTEPLSGTRVRYPQRLDVGRAENRWRTTYSRRHRKNR